MIDHPGLGEKMDDASKLAKAKVMWATRFEITRSVDDVLACWVRVLCLDATAAI